MTIVDSLNQEQWDQFVYEHPKGSIFHTRHMVEVYQHTRNCSPVVLAALDRQAGILALLVSVRVQTLPGLLGAVSSRAIFYAEPLCRHDEEGRAALRALMAEHDAQMRRQALFAEVRNICPPDGERQAMAESGYKLEDYLNYVVDLKRPKEEVWKAMNPGCRSNIRRAQKRGVTFEDITGESNVDLLYEMLQRTYERAKVPLADKSLFEQTVRVLQPLGMVKMFVNRFEGKPVASSIGLVYKNRYYAWYNARERIQGMYGGECNVWQELQWGQEHGCEIYDFGGAGWPNIPYGVRDFKAKFGGDLVQYGRYRKVYSRVKFTLAERGYELARTLVNPKSWARQSV